MATIKKVEKKIKTEIDSNRSIAKKSGLTLAIYNIDGKQEKTIELPKKVFSVSANPNLLAQSVRVYLTNQRQGNVSVKTRGQVTGSTRKIYRQKGTGKARHGPIKAPIFVGGGVAHGPKQKNYHLKFNKKEKKIALFGVLSKKLKEKKIFGLVDQALTIKSKTKIFVNFLTQLKLLSESNLVILPKMEQNNLILAMRNIPGVTFVEVNSLNPYIILKNNNLIIIEKALEVFNNTPKHVD
jgi:large subunit ribosomal protein L4